MKLGKSSAAITGVRSARLSPCGDLIEACSVLLADRSIRLDSGM